MREYVTFSLESMRLAVPLDVVERVIRMVAVHPLPEAPRNVKGVINDHGVLLAVFDLRARLSLPTRRVRADDRLIIVRTPRRRLALQADEVQGVTALDPAGAVPAQGLLNPGGCTHDITRDVDGILMVQDVERFLSIDEEKALDVALEGGRE